LMSDSTVCGGGPAGQVHLFRNEESIPTGCYVMLITGVGDDHWCRAKDGAMVYKVFMNRSQPVWEQCGASIHFLSTQHSYSIRAAVTA
jgi:hypothetical protein